MSGTSLRRLEVFRLVVDCGGVNAAAAHLGVAQPSVSAHLQALEKSLGSQLFRRSRGHRNVITPAGEALYRYACESLSRSADLRRELGHYGADVKSVSLAVQRALANYVMPRILANFLRGKPGVRISVNGETQEACVDLYRARKVDAAIIFSAGTAPSHHGAIIGREPLRLLAAPSHPLTQRKRIRLRDMAGYDFVGGLRHSQFFSLIEDTLTASGLPQYNVALHLQDSVAIKNAVLHGVGIACTLDCVVEEELRDGRLALINVRESLPSLNVELLYGGCEANGELMDELLPHLRAGFDRDANPLSGSGSY